LNLKMSVSFPDVWKKAPLCQEPSESFVYYCAYFLTAITLDKIWLSNKFHPVLCVEHQFLKINLCLVRHKKRYFCEDSNRASGFMVDLAIGYYNEHPTMVEESICKSWFFELRTLSIRVSWSYFHEVWKISQEALKPITVQSVLI